jgi:hypothetical protein
LDLENFGLKPAERRARMLFAGSAGASLGVFGNVNNSLWL